MPSLRAGSQSRTTGTSATTLAMTVPSGAVSGDKIIIFCAAALGSQTWSAPGFTASTAATGSTGSCQILRRTMDGTEGWTPGTSTITVTIGASHAWDAIICAVPGGYDPTPGTGQVNAASTTIAVPGVTTTHTNDLLIWFGFCDGTGGGAGSPGTITVPSGYTAQVSQANTTGVGSVTNIGVLMGTKTVAAAGATGTQNGSASGSFINGGVLVAISTSGAILADAAHTESLNATASMTGGTPVIPYLAGFSATGNNTTATTVPLTSHAVGAGDCVVVCVGLPPTTSLSVAGVSDTKGNQYAAAKVGPGVEAWICADATPLTTSDSVTVSYSGSTSQSKNVVVIGIPAIANTLPVDVASREADDLVGSTAVSVTTGTPQSTGETALLILSSQNAGGAPGTLTGTTLLKQEGSVGGTTQYLTVSYAVAGSGAFTGVATLPTTAAKWGAIALLLQSANIPVTGGVGKIGSYADAGIYQAGDSSFVSQGKLAALVGRPLDCTRIYFGPGNIPASMAAGGLSQYVGVRKVLMSLKPSFSSLSNSDLADLDTFLASCKTGGLVADVTMFHEPAAEKLTDAVYKAGIAFYGPTVRKYFPLVYCQSAYRTHVDKTTNARYYPGDDQVDKIAYDFYSADFLLYGQKLDAMATIADNASPPKPFGIWEWGVQNNTAGGVSADTQAGATSYTNYIISYFTTRLRAGKVNGDISYFDGTNKGTGWDFSIQASSFMIPLYQALYDALSVAPSGAPSTQLADAAVTLGLSMSADMTGGSPAAPPPPPPPPLPVVPPVISSVADWQFTVGPRQPQGGVTLALTDARQKSATFRVAADQYHEASFTISGTSPQAGAFRELISDLQVIRNGQILLAGRIVPTTDTLDGTRHDVQVTALDYREVLRRRMLIDGDTLAFNSTEQALIAWTLIQATQARAGGDLGIARGRGQSTGVNRTQQFSLGDMIGDNISQMGLLDSGYDWDITPYGSSDLRLDIWSPYRGMDRGVILEYGGALVASLTRSVDPSGYANADYLTGQTAGGIPITDYIEDPGIATSGPGRWDRAVGTSIAVLGTLQAKASWYLADGEVVVPSYSIALAPGAWGGTGHIWIGDLVTVRVDSGRLQVNDKLRVTELAVTIGDDGDERVTLAVGRIPPNLNKIAARMLRRIRDLELR